MRQVLNFRLSTALLLIVVAAIALGWYVDRQQNRRDPIGVWHYPFKLGGTGHHSQLEIGRDGTSSKKTHLQIP